MSAPKGCEHHEPQVSLSIPVESGQSPVEAVEEFIHQVEGQARIFVFDVDYGPKKFRVDMADGTVTEVE